MTLSLREQAGAGRNNPAPAEPDEDELAAIAEAEAELEAAKKSGNPRRIRAARQLLRDLYDDE